jgi:hypothetical protein
MYCVAPLARSTQGLSSTSGAGVQHHADDPLTVASGVVSRLQCLKQGSPGTHGGIVLRTSVLARRVPAVSKLCQHTAHSTRKSRRWTAASAPLERSFRRPISSDLDLAAEVSGCPGPAVAFQGWSAVADPADLAGCPVVSDCSVLVDLPWVSPWCSERHRSETNLGTRAGQRCSHVPR